MAPGRQSGDPRSVPGSCLSLVGRAAMLSERATGYFKEEQREGGNREESGRRQELEGMGRLKEEESS